MFDSNNYLQPYGCYQDMIGTLKVTNKYRGRLIIAKKLSPILMEWKKMILSMKIYLYLKMQHFQILFFISL